MDATSATGAAVSGALLSAPAAKDNNGSLSPAEVDISARLESVSRRRSCCNTVEEKSKMRKEWDKRKKLSKGSRKKLLREDIKQLREELAAECKVRKNAELNVIEQRNKARTFWERWRWELEKRWEAMIAFVANAYIHQ